MVEDDEGDDDGAAAGPLRHSVYWIDTTAIKDTLCRIEPWRRVNHFPGMPISHQSRLAKNLARMWKAAPDEYAFFPRTWVLPADMTNFRAQFDAEGRSAKPFIVKPDAGCQGRGIFLTRQLEDVLKTDEGGTMVVQRYIRRPLLVDEFKSTYASTCSSSCNPLRIYLFNDGLTRLCTTKYVKPTTNSIGERCGCI